MEQEIKKIEEEINYLEIWKAGFLRRRFKDSLDSGTIEIMKRGNLTFTGKIIPKPAIIYTELLGFVMFLKIRNVPKDPAIKAVVASYPLHEFIIDGQSGVDTDTLTSIDGVHQLIDNDSVAVTTTSILPSPLSEIVQYWVVESTSTTFKLSLTAGGSPVNITNTGGGTHYFAKLTSIT